MCPALDKGSLHTMSRTYVANHAKHMELGQTNGLVVITNPCLVFEALKPLTTARTRSCNRSVIDEKVQ